MFKNIILTLLLIFAIQVSVFANTVKFVQVADAHFRANDEYRAEVLQKTVKSINNEKNI